jgi:hypothetical protein
MSVATIRACGAPTTNVNGDAVGAAELVIAGEADGTGEGDGVVAVEQATARMAAASMTRRMRTRIRYTG